MAKRNGRAASRKAPAKQVSAYTIVAPNPAFETDGVRLPHFYGKIRFIEGKARITDALARTCTYHDGTTNEEIPFDSAEQLVRYFLDQMSGTPGREWRSVPELADLAGEAATISKHFDRIPEGDDIRVEPKADAPEHVRSSQAAPDSFNPNLGRSRRERIRRQKGAPLVAAQQQRSRDANHETEAAAT